jgi:hypothetical protein
MHESLRRKNEGYYIARRYRGSHTAKKKGAQKSTQLGRLQQSDTLVVILPAGILENEPLATVSIEATEAGVNRSHLNGSRKTLME